MAAEKNNKTLNVPNLRFPEFSGEWEKVHLSRIVTRVTRKNKNNESRLPLTISAQYGLVDQISFFNKVVASSDMSNYYLLHKGEFAYNKSYSGDYPWGAIKRLDRYDKGALSSLYICFTPTDIIDSDFLVHYFESPKWHREVSNIAGEGARNHGLLNIAVPDFFNTQHCIAVNKAEQRKIADFLNLINERIETQKKVIEKYESLIKGIRCNLLKFDSSVRICKLKDICKITTGKLDANAMEEDGIYPFFTCAEEPFTINKYAFDTEALLVSGNGANVGYVNYCNGKFNAYQRTYVLYDFSVDIHYVRYYMDAFLKQRIDQEKNIGNTPYIVLPTLADMKICIPSPTRQQDICRIIKAIETKLTLEKGLYNSHQQVKDFLLRTMFI